MKTGISLIHEKPEAISERQEDRIEEIETKRGCEGGSESERSN